MRRLWAHALAWLLPIGVLRLTPHAVYVGVDHDEHGHPTAYVPVVLDWWAWPQLAPRRSPDWLERIGVALCLVGWLVMIAIVIGVGQDLGVW